MNKQPEDKATNTNKIYRTDKSKQPPVAPAKDQLSEQELEKASGGAIYSGHWD